MNEMEIINLLKDYHDYYNLDLVEIVVEGNRWAIKGCQDKRVVVEKYGGFDK